MTVTKIKFSFVSRGAFEKKNKLLVISLFLKSF